MTRLKKRISLMTGIAVGLIFTTGCEKILSLDIPTDAIHADYHILVSQDVAQTAVWAGLFQPGEKVHIYIPPITKYIILDENEYFELALDSDTQLFTNPDPEEKHDGLSFLDQLALDIFRSFLHSLTPNTSKTTKINRSLSAGEDVMITFYRPSGEKVDSSVIIGNTPTITLPIAETIFDEAVDAITVSWSGLNEEELANTTKVQLYARCTVSHPISNSIFEYLNWLPKAIENNWTTTVKKEVKNTNVVTFTRSEILSDVSPEQGADSCLLVINAKHIKLAPVSTNFAGGNFTVEHESLRVDSSLMLKLEEQRF